MTSEAEHPNFARQVARCALLSRALDRCERENLIPGRAKDPVATVPVQFSATGHEVVQIAIGLVLNHPRDLIAGYYRSRPLALSLGLSPYKALCAALGRSDSPTAGRDTGVVLQFKAPDRPTLLPLSGSVGAQFPALLGWAEAIKLRNGRLRDSTWHGALAVGCGGDGATATSGFWTTLLHAATLRLPILFLIEDNGLAISVPGDLQLPGGDLAAICSTIPHLRIFKDEGSDPVQTIETVRMAVDSARRGTGPVLLHAKVPRIHGHSWQDDQSWRCSHELTAALESDPLPKLCAALELDPEQEARKAETLVEEALDLALKCSAPDARDVSRYLLSLPPICKIVSPVRVDTHERPTMAQALRRTLECQLDKDPRVILLGEDIGRKGGVHTVTRGLIDRFGPDRIIDTALNEAAILGRAIGLALAGFKPIAEIQFRKYLEPAIEQFNDCASLRWRSAGVFSAPVVLRIPVGPALSGDPAHGRYDEVELIRSFGWRVGMPSNPFDAAAMLQAAVEANDPVVLLEPRSLYQTRSDNMDKDHTETETWRARLISRGTELTIVSWGPALLRVKAALKATEVMADLIDLRWLWPWDRALIEESVRRTGQLLVVHDDAKALGLGAEIVAELSERCHHYLKAAPRRIASAPLPCPYHPDLQSKVRDGGMELHEVLAGMMTCPSH